MKDFLQVSLRRQAVYIPEQRISDNPVQLCGTTAVLTANLARLGFGVSEPLLRALNRVTPGFQADLLEQFRHIMKVDQNWTPLVKGWDIPTGESLVDHLITFFVNTFPAGGGTTLACGHIIPANTFPLERYNGCPFCGTPFEFGELVYYGQGSKLKILELWQEPQLKQYLVDLLVSRTALDATQIDSVKILLSAMALPQVEIGMKETSMVVIDQLLGADRQAEVLGLIKTPADILRYLWYKHTGFLQIYKPKTIIRRKKKNSRAVYFPVNKTKIQEEMAASEKEAVKALKLKFHRKHCRTVANWLNKLNMGIEQMCEAMHPQRGMWVRFIRALRLAEYAKKPGYTRLKELLDVFYKDNYAVWQGRLNQYRLQADAANSMQLLKQRPGVFARSLFSHMLWFGKEAVTEAFADIIDKVPARLLFTLNMYAENYFDPRGTRSVKPLGGNSKSIPNNKLLKLYAPEQLEQMKKAIENLCLLAMRKRYALLRTESRSIYIDPVLFKMPVAIGDRSESVQDLPSALMGTRFEVEGDTVRLFMQWGTGLPAQHLDMDLSCWIAYANKAEYCSFNKLVITGCKHSGDIRSIPDKVGTAEYIDINLAELKAAGAQYVTFTCNAYSSGALAPNLTAGWMNSKYPMKIDEKTGVAYDPSCVQQQVRITRKLSKGLVFGVLDIEAGEIIWLEMPFGGQIVQNLDLRGVKGLLKKLTGKLSIGALLRVKAEAQHLEIRETPDADEVYDRQWAANAAAVTRLLVD